MAKRCLSCKRDIADNQKSCFVCGSSQSLIVHYFKSGLLMLVVLLIASAISYQYISKANQEIAANLTKLESAQTQIQLAESKATQALNQLKQLQLAAQQAQSEVAENVAENAETLEKIAVAEKKAEEAQKNVNWLAKQNNQLKTEIQTLTEQLTNAQQNSQLPNNTETEAVINQRIEQAKLADTQTIQTLRQQILDLQQQLATLQANNN